MSAYYGFAIGKGGPAAVKPLKRNLGVLRLQTGITPGALLLQNGFRINLESNS